MRELDGGADPTVTMQALSRELSPLTHQEDQGWQQLGILACVNR